MLKSRPKNCTRSTHNPPSILLSTPKSTKVNKLFRPNSHSRRQFRTPLIPRTFGPQFILPTQHTQPKPPIYPRKVSPTNNLLHPHHSSRAMSSFANNGIDKGEDVPLRPTARTRTKMTPTTENNSTDPIKPLKKASTSWLSKPSKPTQVEKSPAPPSKTPTKRKQHPVTTSESSSPASSGISSSSDYDSSGGGSSSSSSSDFEDSDDGKSKRGKKKVVGTKKSTPIKFESKRQRLTNGQGSGSITDIEDCVDVTILPGPGHVGLQNINANIPATKSKGTKQQPTFQLTPATYQKYINTITQYLLIRDMRHDPESLCHNAPVDTMGCAVSGDKDAEPKVFRFQTLVSLLLSSQTKDATTFDAVTQLQTKLAGGLTPAGVLAEQDLAHQCIAKVGFHNTKIINLIKVSQICQDQYDSDIPPNLQSLLALPGVGPKMANLTLQSAWNDPSAGIGVDTHVHRIVNMLGWIKDEKSPTPEKTRLGLEAVLPPQYFSEINWLLVGFGQTICPSRGPKCGECALAKNLLCGSSTMADHYRKEFTQKAKDYYQKHLQGGITPVYHIINEYHSNNGGGNDDAQSLPPTIPAPLQKELCNTLVQLSLQNEYNITPDRLKSFITDQPPELPGRQ